MGYSSQPINCQCVTLTRGSHTRAAVSVRSGFSLIEVMIAIVLLGFGLVMVATMYPIAWNRARTMTEQSMTGSIADSAEQLLRNVLHVDGLNRGAPAPVFASSFAGDLVMFPNILAPGGIDILYYGDTRVHALNMENMAVRGSLGRRFYPYRGDPTKQQDAIPYLQEQLQPIYPLGDDYGVFAPLFDTGFGRAQIRFEDRIFPPLPPRSGVDRNGVFMTGMPDDQWEEALDTRRFAYAVFHRQRGYPQGYGAAPGTSVQRIVGPDAPNPAAPSGPLIQFALDDRYRDRSFDFYIVTLRRGQASYRFMQQDPDPRFTPDPLQRDMVVNVKGLGQDHDVVLPTPWRVQIFVPNGKPDIAYELNPGTNPGLPDATPGAPSIVHVNNKAYATSSTFVLDMFQPGTWFIDEWNGQVYQVVERRIDVAAANDLAILTLDREMTVPDLDDLCIPGDCIDGNLSAQEQLRTVWVFPPPIEGRTGNGNPIYEGDSPVIGVEVRTLSYSPRP